MVEAPTLLAPGRRHRRPRHRRRSSSGSAAALVGEIVPTRRARRARAQRALRAGAARSSRGRTRSAVTAIDTGGLTHARSVPGRAAGCASTRRAYFLPSAPRGAVAPRRASAAGAQRLRRRRARRRRFNPYIAGAPVLDDAHVLRAREAHRAHAEHAAPQQPDDHGRAAHREDHLPAPPEAGAGGGRGRASGGSSRCSSTCRACPEQAFFHALMAEVVDALALSPATRGRRCASRRSREGYDARDFSHDLQQVHRRAQDAHRAAR